MVVGGAALAALILWHPTGAGADIVTLQALHDATIFENAYLSGGNGATQSNGAGPGMFAGSNSNQSPRRGLVSFDVAGAVPEGATINSVQLQLTVGQVAGSGGAGSGGDSVARTITLSRLTTDWGEGTTGNTATSIGGTGQGFPINPGDATWTQSRFGTTSWTTPGGDTNGVISASTVIPGNSGSVNVTNQTFTWLSTAQLVADVQSMLNSPSTNFGWLLRNINEVDDPSTPGVNEGFQSFRAFYTKEAEAQHLAGAIGPRLIIDYTLAPVPVPAAIWLFGSGIAAMVGIARRNKNRV